ncbi:uncharacterized protein MONOS_3094 [Monocercomonoides exilis]|uniref:uncharacterized protein n=1 Tax=Monocercomonoides exilis TaxID=2049356 RepID=UPI00355ABD7B|nr:hypothetical protein MONOS_3094 [Monocercomonoides exilis]|eukprot:MONOS_3094.1-p1 / transcript=MONOS_3094.1 / gene=MONOS_3094 / organism=Monocercomonoides_exilis_PA203 / gene_product=unspecified product / transcript_product=unspecified product / location=Mono_scaffold00069:104310-110498(-) / protein_length=2063 / sequence_SO=supercontig / SO=protein_coding / is_pseudo=false
MLKVHIKSKIEGCVCALNSSVELKEIGLVGGECGSVVRGRKGSVVVVKGCFVEMGKDNEAGAFNLCGSIGILTNITLKGWGRGGEIYSGRLFGGKGYGGEKGGGEEKGGERESGRDRGREGDGDGEGVEGSISVSESHFSSFCVSSAPFLSSPSMPLISLSKLTFFNISTANDACSPSTTFFSQTNCIMSSCSFWSVCDVYDGGIVHSLNYPLASLTVLNTSFVGCCRTRNVEFIGTEDNLLRPGRQNETFNGVNSFIWCEWNGSNATGTTESWWDGVSTGGAICIYSQSSASVSIKHCSFNECNAYCDGGAVMIISIKSVHIENNLFNACTSQDYEGGGISVGSISTCIKISGCKFQKCKAGCWGGGLHFYDFNTSRSGCIGTESGEGESACMFECSFISCSVTRQYGGGMNCQSVPVQFKMRSIQFISCSAPSNGGGLNVDLRVTAVPSDVHYFYFLFFHECNCRSASTPYGHDVMYYDRYDLFNFSGNPFHECYTTNSNESRLCYAYLQSGSWKYQHTEKKGWLKEGMKDRYVGVGGSDSNNLCGMSESAPCKTLGHAVGSSMALLSSAITLLGGRHVSEGTTISVGEKKISVVGRGKTASVIGTNSLSTSSTTLFSVSSGQLEVGHLGIDHNAERSSSPSVFVVSVGSGALSLEDVVIFSSVNGEREISSSIIVMALFQLRMIDVEIKNLKMSQPLFAEPSSAGSTSGESVLGNVIVRNVNRTGGDGVVMAKSVMAGEIFVVWNTTIEGCFCESGNGGGIKIELASSTSKVLIGDSTSQSGGTTTFKRCKCSECGGGVFLSLTDTDALFELSGDLIFERNEAEHGKNMFISAADLNKSVTNASFNFDYSSMKDDKTLFVGSDDFHQEKDLFMFLIPFSSIEIFISSSGFDVERCGSGEEPCFTMWKGMENMKKEIGNKTIHIEESTIIQDSFNVSNYQIKKSVKMGEENVKAILNFEKAVGSQLEYFMGNDDHLELTNIQLQLTTGFDNSAKTIIFNKGGDLVIAECAFISEAGVNNGFDCVFVDVIGGSVEVNDLSIESCNVGNSIFAINNAGVSCQLKNVRVKLLNESGGCLLLIKGSELTTKINEVCEEMSLNINNSSFSGVKRSDNGPSILESKSEKRFCLVVNESNITEDKAETSEKGGAIFFALGASGSMKMVVSTISQCSCSGSTGKGGGVYLATKERGDLNFTFVGMKFSANTASVGNDIFIECFNITSQINETQFQFDLRENRYSRINAIYGIDECQHSINTDLIGFVTIHQSDTIIVSSVNGLNERQCGTNTLPCFSIDHGLIHLTSDFMSIMIVVEKSVIRKEMNLEEMSLSSKSRDLCEVEVKSNIGKTKDYLISTTGTVSLERVNFVFNSNFISSHESLISPEGGILEIINCSFDSKQSAGEGNIVLANIRFHIINMEKGELQLDRCTISNLILHKSALYLSSLLSSVIDSFTICNSTIKTSLININECGQLTIKDFNTENISVVGNEESLISCLSMKKTMQLANCTIGRVGSKTTKGKLMKVENSLDVKMDSCVFDGSSKERNEKNLNEVEEMCKWEGSLVDVLKSSIIMKDTTISNSPDGGITMNGGNVTIEMGLFESNNPSIERYPSMRRNIICTDSGTLNVMSLKGGDRWKDNTSLWMLNEGCNFEGIISERESSFFIPVLESVEAKEETDKIKLIFKGLLLVPCNLSFAVVKRKGEEKEIEKHNFETNGFLTEREVEGSVGKDLVSNCGEEVEVSVYILFGDKNSPSSTDSIILKNRSVKVKDDERIPEEDNKIEWSLFAFIGSIVVIVILLFVIVVVVVLMRKKQNRGGRRVEDGDIEESKNVGRGEWRKEDITQRVEEEDKLQVLLDEETGNEIGILSEKCKELHPYENKEIIENKFDKEEVVEVVPVNYVEIHTVASLLSSEKDENMESGSFTGGKGDGNLPKRDRKVKRGKRRKGKKRKQVEEIDEIGDERGGSEIGLDELGGEASDDGRNGNPTEYYIGICSAPNIHFSMIGDDSEDQGMKRTMEEERKVVKEVREEGEEIKLKKRKKKQKKNQKREDKSEIVKDVAEMGLLDAG